MWVLLNAEERGKTFCINLSNLINVHEEAKNVQKFLYSIPFRNITKQKSHQRKSPAVSNTENNKAFTAIETFIKAQEVNIHF